jgi:hypothetical protein
MDADGIPLPANASVFRGRPAAGHPGPMAPVVIGVDGSPAGTAALDWAVTEAVLRRRPLVIIHAFAWALMDVPWGRRGTGHPRAGCGTRPRRSSPRPPTGPAPPHRT